MKVILENSDDVDYFLNNHATQECAFKLGSRNFPICVICSFENKAYKTVMRSSSEPFPCEEIIRRDNNQLCPSFEESVKMFQENNPERRDETSQEEIDKKKIDTLNYKALKENMDTKYEQN